MSSLERLTLTNVKEWLRTKAMEASLEQASNFAWLHMKATEAGYHLSNALSRPIGDPPSVAFGGVPVVMLGCSYVPALTSGNLHEREARLVHVRAQVQRTEHRGEPRRRSKIGERCRKRRRTRRECGFCARLQIRGHFRTRGQRSRTT